MKKKNKDKKKDRSFKVILVLDIIVVIGLFLTYGPISYFRNLLITTAMATQSHQYLAYIFYNDDMIEKAMNQNYVEKIEDNTDASAVTFENNSEQEEYANVYEEQVLKRDEGNDLYKIITTEHNGTKAYILVVYDPARIELVTSKQLATGGQKLTGLCKSNDAIAGINASGLTRNAETKAIRPMGTVIDDGKIKYLSPKDGKGVNLIGFNQDNVLILTTEDAQTAIDNGMKDAMSFGPFLIVNGKSAFMEGNGGWGYAPRTAIGQRKDGIVLFVVFDGRNTSLGASMVDLAELMLNYGAYNAANLDGGGSSTMVVNNKLINSPSGWNYSGERSIPNAWIVK